MAKKQKSKTLSTYRKFKATDIGLKVGVFVAPIIPAVVVTGVNWEKWWGEANVSLPFGFACLLLTIASTVLGIMKSDTIIKKKDIGLFYLTFVFILIGVTCIFLASLFSQIGYMFLYTAAGLGTSAVEFVVDERIIQPRRDFYKKLVEDNALDPKSRRKLEKQRRAEEEAKQAEELAKSEKEDCEDDYK